MRYPASPIDTHGYHPLSKFQHWLMAMIWIAAWIIGFIAVHFRDALNAHHELTILHKALASTVVFLTVLRIVWRWKHPVPALPSSMAFVERRPAGARARRRRAEAPFPRPGRCAGQHAAAPGQRRLGSVTTTCATMPPLTRGLEVPKTLPLDVAKLGLAAIEAGEMEVLADDVSRETKQGLSAQPGVYLKLPS